VGVGLAYLYGCVVFRVVWRDVLNGQILRLRFIPAYQFLYLICAKMEGAQGVI
jgi:hypothetical protein